ncbi:LysM peptidoglycan-binding domain-containing protein [Propionimicrobium sp. PCR01-08-3]|uniref:LysM peptidoglycan-binding domain-containing protein n=1 Tax=Propionimicrobium sp. PCR01-08-3 TaxID=3052086 RepID=UPI00255C2B74|nr:LysM peptidoglycan-binding domain-containing protein [Propionimicrobium sp. PCR01-08-3]WIY82553.1 LysM peptidoglycan-binding domain-containing protein [Propionimicrobium sp. PCR01-08-3]
MKKIMKGIAALLVVLAVVAGGAWTLVRFGRPEALWTTSWSQIVTTPDDGSLLLAIITLVGWIAWGMAVASFAGECLAAVTGGRRRLRFPGWQVLAPASAILITAIIAMTAGNAVDVGATKTHAQPPLPPEPPQMTTVNAHDKQADEEQQSPVMATHLVQPGDDLWSLAERYYHDGTLWRQIAEANDSQLLISTDHLEPGMLLVIPDLGVLEDDQPGEHVVVGPGQTLSDLADEHLGDPGRWPEIAALNPQIIDPDLIHANDVLKLPASDADAWTAEPVVPQAEPELEWELCPIPADTDPGPSAAASTNRTPGPVSDHSHQRFVETNTVEINAAQTSPFVALGALVTSTLAAAFTAHRRRQRVKRPLSTVLPSLGSVARAAGIELAHLAEANPPAAKPDLTALPGQLIESADEPDDPEASPGMVPIHRDSTDTDPTDGATIMPLPEDPVGSATEIPLGTLADSAAREQLWCDVELEQVTWLRGPAAACQAMAAAMAVELSASPLSQVVVAGAEFAWLASIDEPHIESYPDSRSAVEWLDTLANQRAGNRGDEVSLMQLRDDPLRSEAWAPVVVILDEAPARMPRRLAGLGLSMVICCAETEPPEGSVVIQVDDGRAEYLPTGEQFRPYQVKPPVREALQELFEVATSTDYPLAPWWATYEPAGLPIVLPTIPRPESAKGGTMAVLPEHPVVRILGTIELVGARGAPPSRAIKQCIEYCAWLLEHPGGTSLSMSKDLMVAEPTRRSNMSRLRGWLGADANGAAYLPEAYSGHICLHPGITSDWEELQTLVSGGVNRVANASLVQALSLVRGEPLADAAPGQWYWAEQLRHDIAAMISDIAVVLSRRAMQAGDLDSAQWAIDQAVLAGADDELLAAARIRLAHLQGDDASADQLILQLTRSARSLGVDLEDETVALLQEVAEGRVRLRHA